MKTSTPSAISEGQETKYRRLLDDSSKHAADLALGKTETDQDGWQRVLEHGDELRDAIAEVVVTKTRELSLSNQFADEERASSYGYLSGYKPKGLTAQTNRLRELFPGIGYANQGLLAQIEKGEVALPPNAEGWMAIPNWIKHPEIFGSTYGKALQKVLDTISQTRNGKFYNYRTDQLGPQSLRQSVRTEKFFRELAEAQGNPDVLLIPAQFGLCHRGRSVRRAREVFAANEFGLGAFAVGIMLLTHPERLQNYDDLWLDCSGDEFAPDADSQFSLAPYFYFSDDKVKFDTYDVSSAVEHYGSVSAVLPQ